MVQTTIRTEGGVRNPKNLFVTSIRIILCFMSHLGFVDDLSSDRNGHRHDLYNLDDRRINDSVFFVPSGLATCVAHVVSNTTRTERWCEWTMRL